jgi:hypothetical protein
MWLIDHRFPDYWFPAKSKIVINSKLAEDNKALVAFIVDPDYPGRWREEPYFSDIKKLARIGIDGFLGQKWVTVVLVKDERIPII